MQKIQPVYLFLIMMLAGCATENKEAGNKRSELKEALTGQWGTPAQGRPTFDITEDSIYHFGNQRSLPYLLDSNTIVITENGLQSRYYNVQIINHDTLYFESPKGSGIAAIRFKEKHPH